jgi:xylulokinase
MSLAEKKPCVVGIDIGTSSCKTLAVDEEGRVLSRATREYPVYNPLPGWSEQDPSDWWEAAKATLLEVSRDVEEKGYTVEGIGLTGQMHGLVLLDGAGNVLRPCIMWNDQRSAPYCAKIHEMVGGEREFIKITNNPMLPGYTGGKILWVRENEPEVFKRAEKFLCPKDYIRLRLTGKYATDVSDASGTGLFSVRERTWAKDLVKELGVAFGLFPEVFESPEITGSVLPAVAQEVGVRSGVPVVGGGGDAVVQTVGVGAIRPGTISITLGTAGIVGMSLDRFYENPGNTLQFFCNAIPGGWIVYGTTLAAGGSLSWFRNTFGGLERELARFIGGSPYDLLSREAELSAPLARGILFLPYLIGERCPHADPFARGVLIGFGLHHTRNDIVRSVFEGIVFSLRDVFALMEDLGLSVSQVRISGGGARSRLFQKLHADIFNSEVLTVAYGEEGGSYGAALLAGVGIGLWSSMEEAVGKLEVMERTLPDPEQARLYGEFFRIYQRLYGVLKETFRTMSSFQT